MIENNTSATPITHKLNQPKNTLRLSWRLMVRDWYSGELLLLVAALLLAISVSTALAVFSDRLQQALGLQVAEIIGADMLVKSPRPCSTKDSGLCTPTTVRVIHNTGVSLCCYCWQ